MRLTRNAAEALASKLRYRHEMDTVIAVLQHHESREVLMVGNMNREAVILTLTTGLVHFWSISRGKIWLKGETSGHYQEVRKVKVDCDEDALVIEVIPKGPTCHTGNQSCFYRNLEELGSSVS
ncbi:phosphoribosyl-AMP cyclohydrolase [Metallosphaera tengchongensis]|uniref:Phosphoribosyl-AMP cyclohydrolase n=1 Tax=Metallosphaera tengchongensis TaxID=1532350 RepID=A0A6N0NWQ5_9CREN|nr:phosphoribosyl-AMP cyclohydrolase [Metallosphaera tengchongensis]QKQ99540.1 phosphoribosyl-AMP cyclohydrolase [Metallosphaera tengchongensis]